MDSNLKREIIMDNYQNPYHKDVPSNLDEYIKVNSNNESCIDNIDLYIKIEDNIIKDVYFMGEACAISTSATSIMIKLLIDKSIDEVLDIINNYEKMIMGDDYREDVLDSALVFNEIYKQQNRKNCAMLPWKGLKKALEENR